MTNSDNVYGTLFARSILYGLQLKPQLYYGTVPEATVAKRRAANKVASKQRMVNRKNGSGK